MKISFLSKSSLRQQAIYAFSLLLIASIVAWLFNPLLPRVSDPFEYFVGLSVSAIGLVIVVYFLHCLAKVGRYLTPLIALLLVSFSYITSNYNVEPGPSFIGAIAETTYEEVQVYFSFGVVAAVIFFSGLYCAVVFISKKFFSYINVFIIIFFVIHALIAQTNKHTRQYTKDMRHAAKWSIEYITDPLKYAGNYLGGEKGRVDALKSLPDPAEQFAKRTFDEPLTVVFFVGESLRADHLGINGYHRDTTPLLAKEKLINFSSVQSSAAWTRESVIGIFSDRLPDSGTSTYGSFVRIFQKVGYSVATYSANTKPNRSDFSFAILTEGAKRFYAPRPDMLMVEKLSKELGSYGPLELHILSPYGSHFSYRDGYPRSQAIFQPDDYAHPVSMNDLERIVNSYDNTVHYTDLVLGATIDLLREKNAILVYTSDHGESLGEEGRFFHGVNAAPEQRHVPLLFWFSDAYREKHPEIISALEKRKDTSVHHSHLFHTFLGIAGIESAVYAPSRDLSRP